MKRSGVAELPLHGGRVPPWLAERMVKLGAAISETIVQQYGASEFLTRLSDPFWFQALGCVMGMDWHSSGITTSVMGALKRGLNPRSQELGIFICGGRGKHSRKTPEELRAYAAICQMDGDSLVRTSRLTARVDNNAIADGFQLYLHNFVVTKAGEWVVVQQGMNVDCKLARRYHWHSKTLRSFTADPHIAIVGAHQGTVMNLVDTRAFASQNAMLEIVKQRPEMTMQDVRRLRMPSHHAVHSEDMDLRRLGAVLAVAHEREFRDFAALLLLETLGPRTLQTLALVAEVMHGAPSRFSDPARFSFALGGKDGHPFPVPLKTYDASISVLRRALDAAKLGHTEKVDGFRRLDQFARTIEERTSPTADFPEILAHERAISNSLDGRTVFDDHRQPLPRKRESQMSLFDE
jgi:uncharacterized protein